MEGLVGTSIPAFITGSGAMSLKGIAANPEQSFNMIAQNAMNVNNVLDIAIKSALIRFGFKFARRALRPTISTINQPLRALSLGVKL